MPCFHEVIRAINKPREVSEGRSPLILDRKPATCAVVCEGISKKFLPCPSKRPQNGVDILQCSEGKAQQSGVCHFVDIKKPPRFHGAVFALVDCFLTAGGAASAGGTAGAGVSVFLIADHAVNGVTQRAEHGGGNQDGAHYIKTFRVNQAWVPADNTFLPALGL